MFYWDFTPTRYIYWRTVIPNMIKRPKLNPVFVMSEDDGDIAVEMGKKDVSSQIPSNQVYFYDDVSRISIFNLNRNLDTVSKTLQLLKINYNLPYIPPLELLVNSEGGEVFSAFSAVDRIKSSTVPIHTYVEGIAASAATLISVVGHKRYIRKNSFMLIHQVRGGLWGSFSEFKDEMQNLELIMKYIRGIYLTHTKIPESDLAEILDHDTYLDANECIKYGLVDEIV